MEYPKRYFQQTLIRLFRWVIEYNDFDKLKFRVTWYSKFLDNVKNFVFFNEFSSKKHSVTLEHVLLSVGRSDSKVIIS